MDFGRIALAQSKRRLKLKNYARAFMMRGVQPRFATMAAPPTLTKGTSTTSSVNGSYTDSVQYNGQSAAVSFLGGATVDTTHLGTPTKLGAWVTLSNGSKIATGLLRTRFQTNAEAVDVLFRESVGLNFNVLVDGEIAYRSRPFGFANTASGRFVKVDFGTNAKTYGLDGSPTVTAGGSGYAVDDIITLNGGSGGAAGTGARLRVAQVSSGAVTLTAVEESGAYTTQPTGTFSQASTTGAGTGATFSASILGVRNSARKMRTIETLVWGAAGIASIKGVVLPSGNLSIVPAPANESVPKVLFVTDSIGAGTYQRYAGGGLGESIAQQLGLWDNHVVSGQGGTGWNQDNGTALRWSHAFRIADVVAEAPDIVVFLGSQNDTAGAALTTAVTNTLTSLQAALPNTVFVGIGPIMTDATAVGASIAAGWAAAPDQKRVRYLDNLSDPKWIITQTEWFETGDVAHPHDDAVAWFAGIASRQIGNALVSMAADL